jgi:hypothetical protein
MKPILLIASMALCTLSASAGIAPNAPLVFKSPTFKAEADAQPITEPKGEQHTYYERVDAIAPYGGSVLVFHEYGIAGEIYFDSATHTAYLKNPVSYLPHGTYIQGTYDDSSITFTFPQPLFDNYGTIYSVYRFEYVESDGSGWFEANPEKQTVKFNINADGTVAMEDSNNGDFIIGLYDDDLAEWRGYGDYNINLTPFSQSPLTAADMPDDFAVSLQDAQLVAARSTSLAKMAEYDGKIYVGGLFESNPEALIVGDIDGDNVTFASGQFVGIDKSTNYYGYFYGMTTTETTDPDVGTIISFEKADNIQFAYNREEQTLTATGSSCGFANDKPEEPYVFSTFIDPVISVLSNNYSKMPAAPTDVEFTEYMPGSMGVLSFQIDNLNVDGQVLDEDSLYYRIFVDGELYTFSADDYYVDEDMTDVPFNFTEGWDFLITDKKRGVLFYYDETPATFAVQLVCKDGDDEYVSALATIEADSIQSVASEKAVSSVSYFDVCGRAIAAPGRGGVSIRVTTFTDGTRSVSKIR